MSCDECTGQRSTVATLGNSAVPALADLLQGPSPRRLENTRRRIAASYHVVPGLTEETYVARMLASYVALNQIRAATSLADIGTPAALRELERALADSDARAYRHDVLRTLKGAVARASHPRFSGVLKPLRANFGDTVRVHAGAIDWDGNETVELNGSPFGQDVFLNRYMTPGNDDSLEFVAVGRVGSYAVSVTNIGATDVTEVDTNLVIQSLRYETHTPSTADVLTQTALPQTRYLVLGLHRNADTTDYLRIMPTADIVATATARWPGVAVVHLSWRACAGPGPSGSTVTGMILSSGSGLGGARIVVPGTGLAAMTTPAGVFSIGMIPPFAAPGGLVTLQFSRIGYRPRTFRVPIGSTGVAFSVVKDGTSPATAMSTASAAVPISAGGCRLLQIWTSPENGYQMVQLKLGQ
jgi:hypothetical protein